MQTDPMSSCPASTGSAVEGPEESGSVKIHADVTGALTYASWQNSVPLVRSLSLENLTTKEVSGLVLEFETIPSFSRPKRWLVDQILPGEEIALHDRHVILDPEYLGGLNEAERGVARFRLTDSTGNLLAEREMDVRLLARDEWGGFVTMPGLIAAFVMPNDPAIARILKEASAILAKHGHASGLDGYQSGDPKRAYMLVAAIWSAVASYRLAYAVPPASFEKQGQKIRRPSAILEQGLGTCLDTTLLFASAIEAAGLNGAVLIVHGHSFTGVWLQPQTFPQLIVSDASEVRKAIMAREFVTFETSCVTHSPPATFNNAIATARAATTEQQEDAFIAAIDIQRARSNQIRPLASHHKSTNDPTGMVEDEFTLPLPPLPSFQDIPDEALELKPSTPAGRIERWQRKLLDLSLRNRLLNFAETKQTVPFLCPDVPYLEDRLTEGARIRIISLPDQNPRGGRDTAIHRQTTGLDFDGEFALQALQRNELPSPLEKRELDSRLTELYRRARNDLNEGGSNTLFLAAGFLRWKRSPEDPRSYRAPLLLVPIKLERRSASSDFHLRLHEDEVRFNATLVQMLKRDFDLDLSLFEGELPTDASGVDVPLVLDRMRKAVRDVPSFEVLNETALSTFSFAKYLMWKDLVDRTDDLRNNRVVRHLIDNPNKPFEAAVTTAFPTERDIDRRYHPKDIVSPLPADSSQLAAVIAAAEGQDFVLIGPPGTGKSQTITNMIAQCLAAGKSVLFVAEKAAALSVVHRRLQEHGLGEFCLELHSNKAERKRFLAQLRASWEAKAEGSDEEWVSVNESLRIQRDELNAYVDALHYRHPNGLSCFAALALVCRGVDSSAPKLSYPAETAHDANAMKELRSIVADLALTRKAVRPLPSLALVGAHDWSMRWQQDFLGMCIDLGEQAAELDRQRANLMAALGLSSEREMNLADLKDLVGMAKTILDVRGTDLSVAFNQQFEQLKTTIKQLEDTIGQFQAAESTLGAAYGDDDVRSMPIDQLQQDWREAGAAIWPNSWLRKRRVRKLLQSYSKEGQSDPDRDLQPLRIMKQAIEATDANALQSHVPGWKGTRTELNGIREHFDQATAVRAALGRVGRLAENVGGIVTAVTACMGPDCKDHPLFNKAQEFQTAMQQFSPLLKTFCQAGGALPREGDFLKVLINGLGELQSNGPALQAWTEWRSVATRARNHGLASCVDVLDTGSVSPDALEQAFELAYARWWLPGAMDQSPVLRQFMRFRHEEALRQFRDLDSQAQALAASRVQRKLARNLPHPQTVPKNSELGLLRHQMGLQLPSKSIREMISAMPTYFGQLAPCVLMSPLSIAQYLPANQSQFDVVIFDEASQITTWDAVGSIARGKQTIIVGDPKQLPPTNFFGRTDGGDHEAEDNYLERDLESILDEAKASGLPEWRLDWHYRSRNESLIAFSNWHYYQNRLVTFPSPQTTDNAVSLTYVADAVYDRGKSRTNSKEAEAIVKDACARMHQWLKLPEDSRPSLGVITFNAQQQSLLQDLFDAALRKEPELEWFFSEDRYEPSMVRNLENVQGDERDIMYFSITFGPDHANKRSNSFGAINRSGGERRLNVAVTRSRRELRVYSSTKAEHIAVSHSSPTGVAHLKTFLDFAERGAVALPAQTTGSVGEMESIFEEAVAEALGSKGWTVVPQVGVSNFRIDLGVVHPEKSGAFLAGIECDGATYHSSATARDRDKVREQVLRGLGWSILRVWSPDWWYDANTVTERIDTALRELLEEDRRKDNDIKEAADMAAEIANNEAQKAASDVLGDGPDNEASRDESAHEETRPSNDNPPDGSLFRRADLSSIESDPARFYEPSYSATIHSMIRTVLESEAPIRDDILAQRIARAHGWLRTGGSIRAHIDKHLHDLAATQEEAALFLWRDEQQKASPTLYRHPATEDDQRAVSDIALLELAAFADGHPAIIDSQDPAAVFARLIGVKRLTKSSRARLDAAIELARNSPPQRDSH